MFLRYLNVSISIFLAIFPADCCWRIRSEDKPLIYDVITCLDRNLNTCTAGNLGKQIRSDTETWKFIENSCRKYASEDSSTSFLGFGIVTRNGKIVSKHRPNLGTDILERVYRNTRELVSWLVYVLCDFKATWHQEASVFLKYTMKIHLADSYILPFWWKSSLHLFLLYILLSQNW